MGHPSCINLNGIIDYFDVKIYYKINYHTHSCNTAENTIITNKKYTPSEQIEYYFRVAIMIVWREGWRLILHSESKMCWKKLYVP